MFEALKQNWNETVSLVAAWNEQNQLHFSCAACLTTN